MTRPTPRNWLPEAQPTPTQLAAWLSACTDNERVAFAEKALKNSDVAHRCLVTDHDGEITFLWAEVNRLNADLAKRVTA